MNLNLTTATRYGLNSLALLGVSTALYLGRSIFIPLTISILLATILWPSAVRLHSRYRIPWFFACLTTVLVMLFSGLAVFLMLALAVPGLMKDLPPPRSDKEEQKKFYTQIRGQVSRIVPLSTDMFPEDPDQSTLFKNIVSTVDEGYVTKAVIDLGKEAALVLYNGILITFILLFLLLEGEMLANKVRNIFGPGPGIQRRITAALAEMAEAVRTYLIWRTIVNIGLGIFLGAVYYSIGLKQWHLWALLTAILCYVPYIGTIVAGIPPVLDALLNLGPGPALGVLIFYCAVVTFEGYIIVPWVMGRSMDLNATTVIISCVFWDYVWGTPGLFLAMPLMAGIKAICLQVDGWRPWGLLMGSGDQKEDREAILKAEKEAEIESQAQAQAQAMADRVAADPDQTVVDLPAPPLPPEPEKPKT